MLPSVVPRLATDSAVRVFPGVWKPLFFRLPSRDGAHPYLFCLSFCLLYFFLPPFEDSGLLFWVPDVFWQHSEVVLGIFSACKCSFDEFVGEKVDSPSYSSAILGPPLLSGFFKTLHLNVKYPLILTLFSFLQNILSVTKVKRR